MEISVVVWKWGQGKYGSHHVNKMYSMLLRHLHLPFRLHCVTDDAIGLHPDIAILTWPFGTLGRARRLRLFDPAVQERLGPRILQLDLDCVIVGDITPLVGRTEPFIIWQSVHNNRWVGSGCGGVLAENRNHASDPYNASMFLMDAGVFPNLWREYCADPDGVERRARKAGYWTALVRDGKANLLNAGDDDQAVVTLYTKPLNPPTWGEADGIYKFKRIVDSGLPDNARMVFFQGRNIAEWASRVPWIMECWK